MAYNILPNGLGATEMDFKHILDCESNENLFPMRNSAILVAERPGRHSVLSDKVTEQDILIRSNVQGWEAV